MIDRWRCVPAVLVSFLALAALLPAPALAQDAESTEPAAAVPPDFATPYATVGAFLENWNYYVESRTDAGQPLDAARRDAALSHLIFAAGIDLPNQVEAANRLVRVLNKLGDAEAEIITVVGRGDPPAGVTEVELFINDTGGFGQILVGQDSAGRWRFTTRTMDSINAIDQAFEDRAEIYENAPTLTTAADSLRSFIPKSLRGTSVLGMQHWQWIALLLWILLAVIIDALVRAGLTSALLRWEKRRGIDTDKKAVARSVRPIGSLAGAFFVLLTISILGLPIGVLSVIQIAARVVVMVSAVWASYGIVDLVGEFLSARASATATKLDDLVVPLLRKTAKVFLTVLGLIYIAESLEVEILPLLTGLGIGGLALGLAAKDSIENFFGSIAVIFDSPFEVGDWVEINGHEGTVEAIGLRSTRIRTFYNSLISVPNATLVRAVVDNYGRRQYRRYTTRLNLTYGTPPDKIEAFCEAVREIVRLHPYTRKDSFHVYMNGFGAHSLDVLVYIFFKCPDWATELRERQRFILDVIRAADAVGVDFAFPTQTIEMKNAGEIRPADPLGIPAQDASQQAVALGREVTRRITSNQAWRDTTPAAIKLEGPPRPDSAGGDG